jgi:hypothetical protein
MSEFSIHQQIEEIDREIALRKHVYARQITKGDMRQSFADYHMGRIEAAKKSLEWLRDNREQVVEWLRAKKAVAA